jgi:hypothetical protein
VVAVRPPRIPLSRGTLTVENAAVKKYLFFRNNIIQVIDYVWCQYTLWWLG